MSPNPDSGEFPELAAENLTIWDTNAGWWDDRIGDGNDFQDLLIQPSTERLLELSPGDVVLDIACGAGRFTRRMAELGARVLAIDHSRKFIDRARERTSSGHLEIEYRVMDATPDTPASRSPRISSPSPARPRAYSANPGHSTASIAPCRCSSIWASEPGLSSTAWKSPAWVESRRPEPASAGTTCRTSRR